MHKAIGIQADAVIITALPVEYVAVISRLREITEYVHPSGTVYEIGLYGRQTIAVVEAGAGNISTAVETERAITTFQPQYVFFVGIAGGVKDVRLGDVVIADKIYGYESGKQSESFLARPYVYSSGYALQQRGRVVARRGDWAKHLDVAEQDRPRAFVGAIAAGEKVVASTSSELFKFLRTNYSDTLAVEMEGAGFLRAAFANHAANAVVVRGISDLIDKKSQADMSGSQEDASRNASAVAFAILESLLTANVQEESSSPESGQTVDASDPVQPVERYSCFISYSSKDQAFAERLYTELVELGVRCWFAPEALSIGDIFRQTIDESIRRYDKVLVILSDHSVESEWVAEEVESAFERERSDKQLVLFPIRIDDAVMTTDRAWAASIRRMRHIGDFTKWEDPGGYQKAFARLLRDLKAADTDS